MQEEEADGGTGPRAFTTAAPNTAGVMISKSERAIAMNITIFFNTFIIQSSRKMYYFDGVYRTEEGLLVEPLNSRSAGGVSVKPTCCADS